MKNEKSPAGLESKRGNISYGGQDEDMKNIFNTLTFRQKKVVNLLLSRKCSAADISIALGYSDPRSHVARIVRKGIKIQSAWVVEPDTRYKIYWIEETSSRSTIPGVKTVGEVMEANFKHLFTEKPKHYD